ncbi:MAG: hypothetical protein J4428_00640 [Candidatus Aenigmarchaeota archaeon]|nr:hypothetical protein [Candidatus Aenigmarchaeota archaeon]
MSPKIEQMQMAELEECEVCRAFVTQSRPNPICQICVKRTCHNCQRGCDRCGQTFCMQHSSTYERWRQGTKHFFKLCEICKDVWK